MITGAREPKINFGEAGLHLESGKSARLSVFTAFVVQSIGIRKR